LEIGIPSGFEWVAKLRINPDLKPLKTTTTFCNEEFSTISVENPKKLSFVVSFEKEFKQENAPYPSGFHLTEWSEFPEAKTQENG
jgi:hypothetical protein